MPPRCCVRNCPTGSASEDGTVLTSLHKFPKDKRDQDEWLAAIPTGLLRAQRKPNATRFICSLHFVKEDYTEFSGAKKAQLRRGASPSCFPRDDIDITKPPVVKRRRTEDSEGTSQPSVPDATATCTSLLGDSHEDKAGYTASTSGPEKAPEPHELHMVMVVPEKVCKRLRTRDRGTWAFVSTTFKKTQTDKLEPPHSLSTVPKVLVSRGTQTEPLRTPTPSCSKATLAIAWQINIACATDRVFSRVQPSSEAEFPSEEELFFCGSVAPREMAPTRRRTQGRF
uniref:THAP-type domain-containing protein n=1 Tax=Ixodes ricinus TaxID=34613 RepID=A0A6B0V747_IXORI